jgi:hypothetical protein
MRKLFSNLLILTLILCCVLSVSATSIVATLGADRIILAADSRADFLVPDSTPGTHHYHDDSCKIIPIGPFAAGVTGNRDYHRNQFTDPMPDWDALRDARSSYELHGSNLAEVAADWAQRAIQHYKLFYSFAPLRVKNLASVNSQNVVVDAFIVGWQADAPVIYWEKVIVDENGLKPITGSEQILPYRALPYSTNGITQQLIGPIAKRRFR